MGFKLTYVLADGATLTDLCGLLDLEKMGFLRSDTGRGYNPDADDFITGADLPSGFALIEVRESNSRILDKDRLQVISSTYPVIYGTLYENVDCNRAMSWLDGSEVWCVDHDGFTNEERHLSVSGSPPGVFEDIRRQAFAKQDEEDQKEEPEAGFIFDIVTDFVDSLTGYKYCGYVKNVHWLRKRSS